MGFLATSLPWAARRITLAPRTSLTPGRETPIRVFDWLSYTRKIWNAVRLQKALYAETRVYKDVSIHHAVLNAKASLWLLWHTAHPARVRLTPNTEQINHRTNCNIPYIWIFWSHTSRGYDRARHAGRSITPRNEVGFLATAVIMFALLESPWLHNQNKLNLP